MRQIPGYHLWIGHSGDVRDLRTVLLAGISALVDLAANELPMTTPRELVYCRFPLVDGAGNADWTLRSATNTVCDFLRSDVPTLVFCSGGMSRSLIIAAAALAVVRPCLFDEALMIVTQSGPADVSPGLRADVQQIVDQKHLQR
jgi:hypothetical protein